MSLRCLTHRVLGLVLGLAAATPVLAGSYVFRSDTYTWETASTALSWSGACTGYTGDDDQATVNFTGGFSFSFAGVAYSSVRVLTNGALQFGADTGFMRSFTNTALPAAAAVAYGGACAASATARTLMPYWTDLNPSEQNSGNVTWQQKGTSPNRYVVISWNGVYEYRASVPYAFQTILYENGDIKFQYGNSNTTGSNATIGVQVSDTDTTLYSVDTNVNRNGTALRVYPALSLPLYLRATGVPASTMNTWVPTTTTLANLDTSRDSVAGLTLKKGGSGAAESDGTRYQRWLTTSGGITLAGTVELRLWTAMKDFRTDKGGSITAYLRDCDASGASCTTIDSAQLTQAGWAGGSTTWVRKTISFGAVNYTVASGRSLELKLIVDNASDDDMWLAYDTTSYASVLDLAAPAVDHYEISLPSTSLACLSSTVTVTACANASSPCTSPLGTLNGQTAALSASAGTLGATSVSFNAGGIASTTLSHPAAANGSVVSVTLSGEQTAAANARRCCPNGVNCAAANSCSSSFNTAGFIVAASANGAATTVPAQTAGTASPTYYLRAVQTNTTTQACEAALTGSTTVNWAAQCNNPVACSAGNLMTLTGTSASAIAGNPNSAVSSYTAVPMSFDANGNAPFTFRYADVGQLTLWASKSVNSATLSGATNAFVTRPAGFVLSNIRQTASPNLVNPGAASAAGARFIKAGESFSATVTSQTAGGAATPNYGKETVPEGVLLTRALVLPSGGAGGALSNATIAGGSFSGGVATVTNLAFSEVGIVTLTPSVADGDYLGAGNVTGTTSGNIGRFVPAQFALSVAAVTQRASLACSPASSFTYLGENFRLGFTLTAQNTAGATTQNYSGSFAKFDPTVASAFNLAGRDAGTVFTIASGRLSLGTATGSWSNGVATALALTANATRATTPDGPFNATFGIAPVDSDGVAMNAFDMASSASGSNDRATVGTVALRFGRLRLASAVGSQTRALNLPVTAQSWTGSAFDTNALDSCTSIAATAVSFGNLRRTLTVADTAVSGSPVALSAGVGRLTLAAPGGGRYGSADVTLSLGSGATDASCLQPWTPGSGDAATAGANLAFLRGAWCASSYDKDPSARATWGLYRGADAVLYQRENY